MKTKFIITALILAGSSAFNYANATSCATSGAPLAREDATWQSAMSDDCAGTYSGNPIGAQGTGLTNLNGGLFDSAVFTSTPASLWSQLVTDDAGGGSATGLVGGIQFTLSSGPTGSSAGSWTMSWTDTNGTNPFNLPIQLDFALAVSGGNVYALYFFNDITFGLGGAGSGTYDISFTNNGGQIPNLSHLAVFTRDPVQLEQPPRPPREVPEPSVLALLGIGLLSISKSFGRKQRGA